VAAAVVARDSFPELRIKFRNGVIGRPDIVYRQQPGFRALKLDLYLPRGRSTHRPLVIYVHGGAWQHGNSRSAGAFEDFPSVLASLTERGFVVASVSYRLSGEAPYPAAIDDVRAAIAFLRANSDAYGVDRDRVILWGSSAGAQLAALAGVECAGRECVQGVVTWYGIFDLRSLERADRAASSPTAAYLDCDPRSCGRAAEASPITHVDASDPPFLILHGQSDEVVAADQSRAMERRLQEAGIAVRSEYFPGIGHSWIGATSADTRRASLAALDRTFAFIESVAGTVRQERNGRPPRGRPVGRR
jgi:acetyl esterase/lipase